MAPKKISKKPLKSTLSKKKKVETSTNVELKQAARAHWSFSTNFQIEKYVFSVNVSHSFSDSQLPGETLEEMDSRIANEAMRGYAKNYAKAIIELEKIKDEAFEELQDGEN